MCRARARNVDIIVILYLDKQRNRTCSKVCAVDRDAGTTCQSRDGELEINKHRAHGNRKFTNDRPAVGQLSRLGYEDIQVGEAKDNSCGRSYPKTLVADPEDPFTLYMILFLESFF